MKLVRKKHITYKQNKQMQHSTNKQMSILQSPNSDTVHDIIIKTIQYKLQQKQFIKLIISAELQEFFDRVKLFI